MAESSSGDRSVAIKEKMQLSAVIPAIEEARKHRPPFVPSVGLPNVVRTPQELMVERVMENCAFKSVLAGVVGMRWLLVDRFYCFTLALSKIFHHRFSKVTGEGYCKDFSGHVCVIGRLVAPYNLHLGKIVPKALNIYRPGPPQTCALKSLCIDKGLVLEPSPPPPPHRKPFFKANNLQYSGGENAMTISLFLAVLL